MKFTQLTIVLLISIISFGYINSNKTIYETKLDNAGKVFGLEYFPLDDTRIFIYKSNLGETVSSKTKIGNEVVLSHLLDDFSYKQNYRITKEDIFLTKTFQKIDMFFLSSEKEITYNSPVLQLPFPLFIDKEWAWEGVEYIEEDSIDIKLTGKVLGEVLLKTEAGEFSCIKVEIKQFSEGELKSTIYQWLAPNVGLVKLSAETNAGGLIGFLQSILGFSTIEFELKKIKES